MTSKFFFGLHFFIILSHTYMRLYFKSDSKIVYDEVLEKLFEKQLELESNLSNSLTEKEHVFENLKKSTHLVKNEVISQYKVNLNNYIISHRLTN